MSEKKVQHLFLSCGRKDWRVMSLPPRRTPPALFSPLPPCPTTTQGHFEFRLCDVSSDPDSVVTQECLNEYQLTRASNYNDASAIDPNYPGRYYLDPPCRADEVEQNVSDELPDGSYNVKMRYKLPDIECEHCVLQMHYREPLGWLSSGGSAHRVGWWGCVRLIKLAHWLRERQYSIRHGFLGSRYRTW